VLLGLRVEQPCILLEELLEKENQAYSYHWLHDILHSSARVLYSLPVTQDAAARGVQLERLHLHHHEKLSLVSTPARQKNT
jgi:hypothetical protein